jgi:2-polyprenyl-3-methyl-5-hydroxy-6-metoxy-1,4-benzoquinol methylase
MRLTISEADIKEVTGLAGYRLLTHQRRKKAIIKLIKMKLSPGHKILDFGCASGDILVELSLLGYQAYGIDLEPVRLKNAKQLASKYNQQIVFENKPYKELINNTTFDTILMGEVLEHFIDPVGVLRDMKFLLKPGGNIVITVPNMPSLRNRLKFGLLGIFPDNNPEHKFYFDYRRFSKIISDAGFIIDCFTTRFINVVLQTRSLAIIENLVLFWFSYLFPKSGDTIFAVIIPNSR